MIDKKEKLEEYIRMGKRNFVFNYGVVRYGLLAGFMMILFEKFILEKKISSFDVTLNILVFGLGGLIVGLWSWKDINKKFKEK